MISDTIKLSPTKEITPEGYLKAQATLTKVGVQHYSGSELSQLTNADLNPTKVYGVFRTPQTVFHPDTIDSAKMKPLTEEHPVNDGRCLTADNFRSNVKGWIGDSVKPMNDKQLHASIMVADKNLVNSILSAGSKGKQVSLGYNVNYKQVSGSYEGEPYDFISDGPMMINHLAVVDKGRCEDGAMILDKANDKEVINMTNQKPQKLTTDASLDMGDLVDRVSAAMQPKIEQIMQSDNFINMLASKVADNITNSDQDVPGNGDGDGDGDMDVVTDEDGADDVPVVSNSTAEAPEQAYMTDSKKVMQRVKIVTLANRLANKDYSASKLSNKQLLVDSLKPYCGDANLVDKSESYLQGVADVLVNNRTKAQENLACINDNAKGNVQGAHSWNVNDINASFVKKLKRGY